MIHVFGIPSCETVKKARAWLDAHRVAYTFHDFKKQGVPTERLDAWLSALGWEALLNRRGATWRQLDDATRAGVTDSASARALMLAKPSVIRRPVVDWGGNVTAGFDPDDWQHRVEAR